jgi:hypothetical protein
MLYPDIRDSKYISPIMLCMIGIIWVVINHQSVKAETYYTNWWLGYWKSAPPEQSAGLLYVYYTYPDMVFTGQNFTVGINLEYVKDKRAILDWIVFSRVSVGLKDILELGDPDTFPPDTGNVTDNSSRIVRPGEQYSYALTLTAPLTPGEYVIFPRWNAFYGPGTTANNNFDWRMESYYNQTQRQFGVIDPVDDLPPIEVIEQNGQNIIEYANLTVFINSPYSSIKPIEVSVASTEDPNLAYHQLTQTDGSVLFHMPFNSTYAITVPGIIEIVPGKIRAVFVNWTDGQSFGSLNYDSTRHITRVADMHHDLELVPIYKTQYYLAVRSNDIKSTNSDNGTGWYDSGDSAQFSIQTLGAFLTLHSFDHWNGTIPDGQGSATSGSIGMDGPKEITAIWKFDFGYLGLMLGIVTASITVFGTIRSKRHTFFSLISKLAYWKKE